MDDEVDLEVVDEIEDDLEEETLPSRTYQVKDGRIRSMTDGREAMVQAVDKILRTERFVFPIYDEDYGNDFNELLGKEFDYAEVEVERMLGEALYADDRVTDVSVDEIQKTDLTTLVVTGTVETIFGTIPIESEVTLGESTNGD
ncbi:DUF2634 domain-containing protein [Levilactobacillus namurensis]|uniref:DUF2634 domain-containing protein n=1 Tax=Levilactobacillus namurensis TaxID=380393 RepID=A0AAW8W8A9_9LACO|nr:DUF2634 domain-containing protein [Levilactobacillus namurensis]MDT7015135.1 DUF2634 domain-containing protein [Levilactobacillus namurensis]MDT7015314.1 DUF2634 domain-containing protein [Levilactobacillus namurensis]MDT7015558.1 DUF2634 domain-containing protein [Levilactobacillus namurensis]